MRWMCAMLMMFPVNRIGFCANAAATLVYNAHSHKNGMHTNAQNKRRKKNGIDKHFLCCDHSESRQQANASTNHMLRHEVVIWMQQRTFLMTYLQFDCTTKKKATEGIKHIPIRPGHTCACVGRNESHANRYNSIRLTWMFSNLKWASRLTSSQQFTNESNTILVSCRLFVSFVVIFMAFHINTHIVCDTFHVRPFRILKCQKDTVPEYLPWYFIHSHQSKFSFLYRWAHTFGRLLFCWFGLSFPFTMFMTFSISRHDTPIVANI